MLFQEYKPIPFRVESDWSAASYWYEIVSFGDRAEVLLTQLNKNSVQGGRLKWLKFSINWV